MSCKIKVKKDNRRQEEGNVSSLTYIFNLKSYNYPKMLVTDLSVYKKLCDLHLEVHDASLEFPKFELYELGSQVRRSSNSAPANLAEGFGNKHTNIFTECISRAQGEIRETIHHLYIAFRKAYISEATYTDITKRYVECAKMLYGLENALLKKQK